MTDKINFSELISDELLAAYLDGNTTPEENNLILSSVTHDSNVFDVFSTASEATEINRLIPVLEAEFGDSHLVNDLIHFDDRFDDLGGSNQDDDKINQMKSNLQNIEVKTYGEERNYHLDSFDLNISQGPTNACAVKSQEIILRDYGIIVPQTELEKFAEANGWYDTVKGTPYGSVGNILEAYGIDVKQSEGNTIFDLVNELKDGHRVIVGIDADELWAKSWIKTEWEHFRDLHDPHGANHALIVAGVEVDPHDMNDIKVILTDPGKGDLRIEYPLDKFMDAWADGNFMMISTTQPAPYQYNAETHQMEYSQFATDFNPHSIYEFEHFTLPDFNTYHPFFDSGYFDLHEFLNHHGMTDLLLPSLEDMNSLLPHTPDIIALPDIDSLSSSHPDSDDFDSHSLDDNDFNDNIV